MIIQHNISAMNANRQLNITGGALEKSTRNLSSGYKINVAADDAAGLSISEKMRRQIRGLTQGVQNTEDGVSLCQVADGALSEVQDMLQRINELAVQAANGTNSESDRSYINDEVTQLLAEIDRIGDTTKFNEVFIFKATEMRTREKWVTVGGNGTVSKPQIIPTPPFSEMTMDCELTEGPFSQRNTGNHLALAARSTKEGAQGTWNLIFGSGSTSSPKLVITNPLPTSTSLSCIEVNLRNITPTSYSHTANTGVVGEKKWTRIFNYSGNGVNIDIAQSVTLHNKDADGNSQYYTVDYEITNNSGIDVTYNLVHHEDTAYNNNDRVESYHLRGGNRIENASIYTTENHPIAVGDTRPNVHTSTIPDSFSIINMQAALSFSENIIVKTDNPNEQADTLIVGQYSSVGALSEYTPDTMNGILGASTQGMDIGFSLVWSNKQLADGSSQTYSFKQGIVNVDTDENIDQDLVIKAPTVNIAPAPPKPILVEKDYLGGEHQLWIQSGADAGDGMVLRVGAMNTGVLDIDDIVTLTEWTADDAIDRVSYALSEISKQRSRIGAYQNRLEHTIANEDNIVENTTAAESQIRDTDIAKEMVQYANKNILMQAGQSILSQANQSRQGILSLLAA